MIGGLFMSPLEWADWARHFEGIGRKGITRDGTEPKYGITKP